MNAFLAGLFTAAVLAWPFYRFLLAIRSRQTVSQHVKEHAHKQGTPTMGGLMILSGLAGLLVTMAAQGEGKFSGGMAVFLGLMAFVGFVDDFLIPRLMPGKRGLGWIPKLAMEFGAAGIGLYALGVTSPPALILGVFVVLFYANAYNFADGLDWLSGTILVAYVFGVLLIGGTGGLRGEMAFGLLGAMVPFLVMNKPKAKIFMGDVGSMPLGGLLGVLTLSLVGATPLGGPLEGSARLMFAVAVLSFVMLAELLPPPLQILSVKLRKKRIFPFTPIHHAFQKAGWPETRVVALFAGVQLLCSLVAWGVSR
ncbi:phospho-N-acetylmuramoyl-pentapeptide-transferase [soil metagenome]